MKKKSLGEIRKIVREEIKRYFAEEGSPNETNEPTHTSIVGLINELFKKKWKRILCSDDPGSRLIGFMVREGYEENSKANWFAIEYDVCERLLPEYPKLKFFLKASGRERVAIAAEEKKFKHFAEFYDSLK